MYTFYSFCTLSLLIISWSSSVRGHGRLIEPASRASAWRYGWETPANYDDNGLNCGGFQRQWGQNSGRCGVCGDAWDSARPHEAGGRYATGTIVDTYSEGQVIETKVDLTANHKGWFEFRLCPTNNARRRTTQQCLDRYLLRLADSGSTRVPISSDMRIVTARLQLPAGLTCSQCVLQWKYNTGNSWGTDTATGQGCVGCGPQEQFYGCADVAITSSQQQNVGGRPGNQGRRPPAPAARPGNQGRTPPAPAARPGNQGRTPPAPAARPGNQGRTPPAPAARLGNQGRTPPAPAARPGNQAPSSTGSHTSQACRPTGLYRDQPGMATWCQENCRRGFCPASHCIC